MLRLARPVVMGLSLLLSSASAGATSPPEDDRYSVAVGIVAGHPWLRRESGNDDDDAPSATYFGAWASLPLGLILSLGVEASTTFPVGSSCHYENPCDSYRLTRLTAFGETRFVPFGEPVQAFELWASLGADAVVTSERIDGSLESTDWGFGVTGRGGPRVRMRGLTLSPYVEGLAMTAGNNHTGWGFGFQAGLRF